MLHLKFNIMENHTELGAFGLFITVLMLVFYYVDVLEEAFSSTYVVSPLIGTKRDFIKSLIPFYMWAKKFLICYNNLK